jgi:hypothetical protein
VPVPTNLALASAGRDGHPPPVSARRPLAWRQQGTADGTADLIPRADILALAGPPARTYQFQSFTIMVWNTNLIPLLGTPLSTLPGNIGHT